MRFAEKVLVLTLLSGFVLQSNGVEKQPQKMAWADVEKRTAELGAELLRSFFKEGAAREKLGETKESVAALEAQLSLHSSASGSIPDFEFMQQAVAGMKNILTAPCSVLETLEERIELLRANEEILENDMPAVKRVLTKRGRRKFSGGYEALVVIE